MGKDLLTKEDKEWLFCSGLRAETTKANLIVIPTDKVKIMLHNLRYEINELRTVLNEVLEVESDSYKLGDEIINSYFPELCEKARKVLGK